MTTEREGMRGGARELLERVRRGQAHRDYGRTVEYDANLPDSLGRRGDGAVPAEKAIS